MVKNLIRWICLGIFLTACEQEETLYRGESENHRCSIPLSLASDLRIQGGTDYVPMYTKADDAIKTELENACRCLLLKKIDSKWYVDDLLQLPLDKGASPYTTLTVGSDGTIGSIEMTLRPGYYHLLVVTNAWGVEWNPALTRGYLVKDETAPQNETPYAFTYSVEDDAQYLNKGYRYLSKEIFTGTYEFTVSKTGDLHSASVNGNGQVNLTRKLSRLRVLLKYTPSTDKRPAFNPTAHYIYPVLKATGDVPFCDGIDCWGDAYYNRENPTYELPMCISTTEEAKAATNGASYQLTLPKNSTYPSAFIFTDETKTEGIPYEISIAKILSYSGGPTYYYDGVIPGHVLYPNSIDGLVFQTTDQVKQGSGGSLSIKVEQVPEESAVALFPPFYEANQR